MVRNLWLALFACLTGGIAICQAQSLPVLTITTAGSSDIVTKQWQAHTALVLTDAAGHEAYRTADAKVKGRGHSTFQHPKKPYAVKLPNGVSLLGMRASRRWVLLANFMDHSLLRTTLAFAAARLTSLPLTPEDRQAEVVVNGKRRGCYLLTGGMNAVAEQLAEGDALLEADSHDDGDIAFRTARRLLPFHVKWPKRMSRRTVDSLRP